MTERPSSKIKREVSVRNWPFQAPPCDTSFTLSPAEKTELANWNAHGAHWDTDWNALKMAMDQRLTRLIQPIEAALLHYGCQKGNINRNHACISLLLHEMHRRQTSLWAWDDTTWVEIVGQTDKEFKSIHYASKDARHISAVYSRQGIMACAYLLCRIQIYKLVGNCHTLVAARNIFGGVAVEKALHILSSESKRIGRGPLLLVNIATCSALLANCNPVLEKLTLPVLEKLCEGSSSHNRSKNSYIFLSVLLYNLAILPDCLPTPIQNRRGIIGIDDAMSADWVATIQTWSDNTTYVDKALNRKKAAIAIAARWDTENYPNAAGPQHWTESRAIAFVTAVVRIDKKQWRHPRTRSTHKRGEPAKPSYKKDLLESLRIFFSECHHAKLFPLSFDPKYYLATHKSLLRRRRQNPRPIAPALWAKLREAGLSLTKEDLPIINSTSVKSSKASPKSWYPLAMVRAIAIIWLSTGLRLDEIRRLKVGCIQPAFWEENEHSSSSTPTICSLTVPRGKSDFSFSRPVLKVVGDAIELWEKMRPSIPEQWDYRSKEEVDFLFVWKGKQIPYSYINEKLIPMLCRKAGIPVEDAFGKITSHRARHTIAHELINAPIPMDASSVQYLFGHRSNNVLSFYTGVNERELQDAYARANQVSADKRQLKQLEEPTTTSDVPTPEDDSLSSVDLGHGFCAYDYFDSCSQQGPCTNCLFYKPKVSYYSQLQESKSQLLGMLNHLPLPKEARQAVEDGIALNERLVAIMRSNEENHTN